MNTYSTKWKFAFLVFNVSNNNKKCDSTNEAKNSLLTKWWWKILFTENLLELYSMDMHRQKHCNSYFSSLFFFICVDSVFLLCVLCRWMNTPLMKYKMHEFFFSEFHSVIECGFVNCNKYIMQYAFSFKYNH